MVDKKQTLADLRAGVFPVLKSMGFAKRESSRLWRHTAETVDVVDISFVSMDFAEIIGCPAGSISVECGVFLPFVPRHPSFTIPEKGGLLLPKGHDCAFRGRLTKSIQQSGPDREDIWFVGSEHDLGEVVSDIRSQIETTMPRWFAQCKDFDVMLDFLHTKEEGAQGEGFRYPFDAGNLGSPLRLQLIAAVSVHVGKYDEARQAIAKLAEDSFNDATVALLNAQLASALS